MTGLSGTVLFLGLDEDVGVGVVLFLCELGVEREGDVVEGEGVEGEVVEREGEVVEREGDEERLPLDPEEPEERVFLRKDPPPLRPPRLLP